MSVRPTHTLSLELIHRLEQGDQEALRPLYLYYYEPLLKYGCSIENREDLVHDEIQELFVWLLQHPDKLRHIRNVRTYLFRCIRRNLRSTLRNQRLSADQAQRFHQAQTDETPSGYAWTEAQDESSQLARLRQQIRLLPSHQREIIFLRFYENLTNEEIAEIFETTNQVVRNTVCRALKNLRKKLIALKDLPLPYLALMWIDIL